MRQETPERNRKLVSVTQAKLLRKIPGYDAITTAGECWYDASEANNRLAFFPDYLSHVKGDKGKSPFRLESWEKALIANLFGWKRPDGTRRYRECFLFIPRKNGKALAIDTPICTPKGWETMGDLKAGDVVFDENGAPCRVTFATDVMYNHRCFAVKFSDGEVIIADAEHQWETHTRKPEHGVGVYTTEQIAASLLVGNRGYDRNHSIPVTKSLHMPEQELLIDPYALGVWLGDGDSRSAQITLSADDRELLEHLQYCGVSVDSIVPEKRSPHILTAGIGGIKSYDFPTCRRGHLKDSSRSKTQRCLTCERMTDYARRHGLPMPGYVRWSLQEKLRMLGVLGNKHIPDLYLRASIAQRFALLQGLMDTDGTCSSRGQCEFSTTNPALRDGFLELARSLGLKPTLKTAMARCNGVVTGEVFRIQFFAFQDTPVFRLTRKFKRQKLPPASLPRSKSRQIVAVEPIESVPVKCIQVDSPSHLYLAGKGMIPTHNTALAAGIVLSVLFQDQESGMEVYSAAADREQASLVFSQVEGMVLQSAELSARCQIYKTARSVVMENRVSSYKVISADAASKHGFNSHLVIIDELHAQPNRELVDVLMTSTGARRQPLIMHVTTSDFERPSICNEKYNYACKVRDGIIKDASFLPIIYEAPKLWEGEIADYTSPIFYSNPAIWRHANPNLGVSLSLEYMERECMRAQETPSYLNTFLRLHLNVKTQADVAWLNMTSWDACEQALDLSELEGESCYGGLDMASTSDLIALVLVFPAKGHAVFPVFWLPAETALQRERRSSVPYPAWAQQGFIRLTPGNVADYDRVRQDIRDLGERFHIQEIAIDRWNATQITTQLEADGFTMVPFGQGFASLSAPSKELERLVIARGLQHNGHPVLRWCASNVMIESDAAGNIKPSKKKSSEKIDGIVALTMALGRAMVRPEDAGSVYDQRGLLAV